MPHFDKHLEAVTSAAVANWKRQKEELIRSDFLSYKSGLTAQRTQVWAPAVQSEWLVLGINDIETHKILQSALSKLKAPSNRGLDYYWELYPKSPLPPHHPIIVNTSHFQLHLQPVLCRVGPLNQKMPGFIVSLHILHFDIILTHFPPLSSPTPMLQSMTVIKS